MRTLQDIRFVRLDPSCPASVRPAGPAADTGAPAAMDAAPALRMRAVGLHPRGVLVEADDEQARNALAATAPGARFEVALTTAQGDLHLPARLQANGAPAGAHALAFEDLDPPLQDRIEAFLTRHRKADHIRICRDDDVLTDGVRTGFERYRLPHEALPEVDKRAVDLSTEILGKRLQAPFLISCMTGGSELAKVVNERLARAAHKLGFALGLGSQRALLKAPDLLDTYDVRALAPDVLLLGNVGAVQLNYGLTPEDCDHLVSLVQADALVLHLNALQEAVQPEGDVDFRGLKGKIEALAARSAYPIVLKEVGNGLGPGLCRWAATTAIAGVDVAGAGGTSWSKVESYRAQDPVLARVARAFGGWGWPTAEALIGARAALPDRLIVASGGITDGIEAAKALALGADLVGLARPFLEAACQSEEAVLELGRELCEMLRVAMFCAGASDLRTLRTVEMVRQ